MSAPMLTFMSVNSTVCFLLCWPSNLLLCWLIIYKTNSLMRVWSHILLQSALIDLVISALLFLLQPMFLVDNMRIYCFINSPLVLFDSTSTWIFSQICAFWLEFCRYAISVQFVYRWLVLCRQKQLSSGKYALFLLVPASMAFTVVLLMKLAMFFEGKADLHCSTCPPDRAVTYGISLESNFTKAVGLAIILFNAITYSTIFLTNFLIWRKSRTDLMTTTQQRSRELSHQVGQVLLVQAIFPLALTLLPTLLPIISLMTQTLNSDWLMILFFQYWPALVNPVATIIIVRQYRRVLLESIGAKQPVSNAQQQQQQQQTIRPFHNSVHVLNASN